MSPITKQIEALSKVANLITSGLYLEELLRLIVHVTAEIMNSKISSLMYFWEQGTFFLVQR